MKLTPLRELDGEFWDHLDPDEREKVFTSGHIPTDPEYVSKLGGLLKDVNRVRRAAERWHPDDPIPERLNVADLLELIERLSINVTLQYNFVRAQP